MAASYCALGQTVATPEDVIRRIITTGTSEGHDQKVIGFMGDAAAIAITKFVGERRLSNSETEMILYVLVSAFADARAIRDPGDVQPKTALFVLRLLSLNSKDPGMQKKILEARERIISAGSEEAKPKG